MLVPVFRNSFVKSLHCHYHGRKIKKFRYTITTLGSGLNGSTPIQAYAFRDMTKVVVVTIVVRQKEVALLSQYRAKV